MLNIFLKMGRKRGDNCGVELICFYFEQVLNGRFVQGILFQTASSSGRYHVALLIVVDVFLFSWYFL